MENESGFVITGRENISKARLLVIHEGLKLEKLGMRMTRGRTCRAIVKAEFGIKFRDMDKVIAAFEEVLRKEGVNFRAST